MTAMSLMEMHTQYRYKHSEVNLGLAPNRTKAKVVVSPPQHSEVVYADDVTIHEGVHCDPRHHLGISIDTLVALAEDTDGLLIPRGLTRAERRAYVRANATYHKG